MNDWAKQNAQGREIALQIIEEMRLSGSPADLVKALRALIERGNFGAREVGFCYAVAISLLIQFH